MPFYPVSSILVLLFVPMAFINLSAQSATVESPAYRIMLRSLLSHTVPEISVSEAHTKLKDYLFLDAREPAEYRVSKISGARPVGYDHFDLDSVSDIPKDQPIIVYCSVGYRSEKVAEQLRAAGYQRVFNLYGGIFEWKNQGLEIVSPDGAPTERIHAYNRAWGLWLRKGKKVY